MGAAGARHSHVTSPHTRWRATGFRDGVLAAFELDQRFAVTDASRHRMQLTVTARTVGEFALQLQQFLDGAPLARLGQSKRVRALIRRRVLAEEPEARIATASSPWLVGCCLADSGLLHYVLRFACACQFIGHGAYGAILAKASWVGYFAVLGLSQTTVESLGVFNIVGGRTSRWD
jgi:hypothetical protein